MGLLAKIRQLVRGFRGDERRREETEEFRRCRFESMEPRRLLSADPIQMGVVYIEQDTGADLHGDTFELTFVGGAPETELTQVLINGDRGAPGFGNGDVFYDTQEGGLGADHGVPFQVVSLQTADPQATVTASVADGSTLLTLNFSGFRAGDKLVFAIDVDEVEDFDPQVTDPALANEGIDPITSGVEFQASKLTAHFRASHYHDTSNSADFRNSYDAAFSGSGLDLPADNFQGKRDRSTGAIVGLQQVPLPVAISGQVYLEQDLDLVQDGGEPGIGNVELALWVKGDAGYSFTGHTTLTDDGGHYEFGTDLNLLPGTYQVRQTQPDGLFSVGAIPGTVDGSTAGTTVSGDPNVLTEMTIPLGDQRSINNDFAEAEPVSISGQVYHDRSNDGLRGSGEEGIPGVGLQIIPVNTIATQATVTVQTDSSGFYQALGMSPGQYRIVQTPQPAGFFDGLDTPGTVNGVPVGTVSNPGDSLESILLAGGQVGVNYNFGELVPASIRGRVGLTDRNGDCNGTEWRSISDAVVRLLDSQGELLAETRTNDDGEYEFTGLLPGQYSVVELTPEGLIDGDANVGTVNGSGRGVAGVGTVTAITLGSSDSGVDYNFCEHEPATISGFVYHDENNNGTMDYGEAPIPDAEVVLLDAAGTPTAQRTDSEGYYEFTGLSAGTYALTETQPNGWLDGQDSAGEVNGEPMGTATNPGDRIQDISVLWGDESSRNDFGELLPGSISGQVHADTDGDCVLDEGEQALAGVVIELLDADGNVLATTQTDTDGRYVFSGLAPGVYGIHEVQPAGVFHGDQHAGSHGGFDLVDDYVTEIDVGSGQNLVDYDFCEIPPASLSGMVFVDPNQDCLFNGSDRPLSGVVVELLDLLDSVVATTTTDSSGRYRFENLEPGVYSVRESQPDGYFNGGQTVGTGGGDVFEDNLMSLVLVAAGDNLTDYNFCELPPASISGFVFQDGPAISANSNELTPQQVGLLRDGLFTSDDTPLPGVLLRLRDGFTGEPIDASEALPGHYAPGAIEVMTDASGYYQFTGIQGGRSYAVYQVHPDEFVDSIDTVGTTSGFAFNPQRVVEGQIVLEPLADQPASDAIIRIGVAPGQSSVNNNFSEVRLEPQVVPPPIIPPITPPPPVIFPPPSSPLPPILDLPGPSVTRSAPVQSLVSWISPRNNVMVETFAGSIGHSWHLSVINGGMPREMAASSDVDDSVWRMATHLDHTKWTAEQLEEGRWVIGTDQTDRNAGPRRLLFGIRTASPFTGDFNGDGKSEIGIFYRGEWFIDLNGNGVWDEGDMWAKLGDDLDRPVVGDWDGDGKDDIGIYGPEWFGDQRQIDKESGLPDSQNLAAVNADSKPKNVPPVKEEATDGQRLLRLNAQGPRRADVIDHVFRFGSEADTPVAGDWNGDGIRSVGVFHGGEWRMDTNGDGRSDALDKSFRFGHPGDIPVVGDWDGNGVEEVGVYRSGQWILDVNGNRELDAHDRVFEMGGAADRPVVGDWNGDGVDEPGVYRDVPGAVEVPVSNVKP